MEKKLKLKVNEAKSRVDRVSERKFLGFSFTKEVACRIKIAPQAMERVKKKLRSMTSRTQSINMNERLRRINDYMRGWLAYFHIVETPSSIEQLEQRLRRRLRQCRLREWKLSKTKLRELRALKLDSDRAAEIAYSSKGSWRLSMTPQLHRAMGIVYWKSQGMMDVMGHYNKLRSAT